MQPYVTQPPTANTCKALWLLQLPELTALPLTAFMFLRKQIMRPFLLSGN